MENPINPWDDLGGKPTIFGNPHLAYEQFTVRPLSRVWADSMMHSRNPGIQLHLGDLSLTVTAGEVKINTSRYLVITYFDHFC